MRIASVTPNENQAGQLIRQHLAWFELKIIKSILLYISLLHQTEKVDIKSFDCQMKSRRSENLNWGVCMVQWLPIFISNFLFA